MFDKLIEYEIPFSHNIFGNPCHPKNHMPCPKQLSPQLIRQVVQVVGHQVDGGIGRGFGGLLMAPLAGAADEGRTEAHLLC